MTALEKATLQRLTGGERPEPDGEPVPVQFNPASLRLSLSNSVEGGESQGRQQRQFNGQSSTDVSFDLVFDTADEESSNGEPRSVRERTATIEQFVVPMPDPSDSSQRLVPPRVRFAWGDLTVDGIISNLEIDFDHFAENGIPLRAKVTVAIKEQDSRYEIQVGQTASGSSPAPSPGAPGLAGPGLSGGFGLSASASLSAGFSAGVSGGFGAGFSAGASFGASVQTGVALGGESLADFSTRMGLDANAWRGLSAGIDSTLSLDAGLEIDFDASISAELGLGSHVAFSAGADVSVEGALGLDVSASASLSASLDAGFALSAAGGVVAALELAAATQASVAATAAKAAFGVSTSSSATGGPSVAAIAGVAASASAAVARSQALAPRGAQGAQVAQITTATDSNAGLASQAAPLERAAPSAKPPPAPPPPRADPRAKSFGRGVPLAPRRDPGVTAPDVRRSLVSNAPPARVRARLGVDPTEAPWRRLEQNTPARSEGDRVSHGRRCACCRPGRGKHR